VTDFSSFPSIVLHGSARLFRIHQAINGPAFFGSTGAWRFDPPAADRGKYGVCYLATNPLGPYVEVFGRIGTVPAGEVAVRRLTECEMGDDLRLADLTDRSVVGRFGITGDYSMGADYSPAQALSAELFAAGFDGISYRLRHDPEMQLNGVALFGAPGEQPGRLCDVITTEIPPSLIKSGESYGIRVIGYAPLP
jgi:hypothetical protein